MIVTSCEWLHQVFDNFTPKVFLNCSLLPSVHGEVADVAIGTVGPHPNLEPPPDRLHWDILFDRGAAIKLHHCLINGILSVGFVVGEEGCPN